MKYHFQLSLFFYFIFTIFSNFQKTTQYYTTQYGNITVQYFNDSSCINTENSIYTSFIANETPSITCDYRNYTEENDENCIFILKYKFDFYSSSLKYYLVNKTKFGDDIDISDLFDDDEELKDGVEAGVFTCNTGCYKNGLNTDKFDGFTNKKVYNYYSCLYTNIIKSATIKINNYRDKNCENIIGNTKNYNGSNYCYKENSGSFRLLYYEDRGHRLYYHNYTDNEECKGESYQINQNFYKCNNKCNRMENRNTYYKCEFKDNKSSWIDSNKIMLLILLINYLL